MRCTNMRARPLLPLLAAAFLLGLALGCCFGAGGAAFARPPPARGVGLLERVGVGVGSARVQLETLRERKPYIQLVHDFLSPKEISHVVRLAEAQTFASSTIASKGGDAVDGDRTSSTCHLATAHDNIIQAIEKRAATLLRTPAACVEPLQVVKYGAQQQYKPHFDYFPEKSDYFVANTHHGYVDEDGREHPNQRLYTLFVYLNQPDAAHTACAGGTVFPECNYEIIPKKGMAVLFHNLDERGREDTMALHGGARNRCSSRGFTKYGLNIWVRAFPYPSSAGAPPAAGYLASVPACQPCDKVHPQVRCAAAT